MAEPLPDHPHAVLLQDAEGLPEMQELQMGELLQCQNQKLAGANELVCGVRNRIGVGLLILNDELFVLENVVRQNSTAKEFTSGVGGAPHLLLSVSIATRLFKLSEIITPNSVHCDVRVSPTQDTRFN